MRVKERVTTAGELLAGPVTAVAVFELLALAVYAVAGAIPFIQEAPSGFIAATPFVASWWHLLVVPLVGGPAVVVAFALIVAPMLGVNVLVAYWDAFGVREGVRRLADPRFQFRMGGVIDHPVPMIVRSKRCPECMAWAGRVSAGLYNKYPSQYRFRCGSCGHEFRREVRQCAERVGL